MAVVGAKNKIKHGGKTVTVPVPINSSLAQVAKLGAKALGLATASGKVSLYRQRGGMIVAKPGWTILTHVRELKKGHSHTPSIGVIVQREGSDSNLVDLDSDAMESEDSQLSEPPKTKMPRAIDSKQSLLEVSPRELQPLGEEIGRGGFGIVFKFRLRGTLTAIKVLKLVRILLSFCTSIHMHPALCLCDLVHAFYRRRVKVFATPFSPSWSLWPNIAIHTLLMLWAIVLSHP